MSTIALSPTALVPTIRDSLRCQLEAKLGVLLTERQAIDIARNLAQAVMGLEIDETHVIDTSRHHDRCMTPFDDGHLTCPIVAGGGGVMVTAAELTADHVRALADAATADGDERTVADCLAVLYVTTPKPTLKEWYAAQRRVVAAINTRAANAIEGDGHIRDCGNGGSDPADCSPECARVNARAAKSETSK